MSSSVGRHEGKNMLINSNPVGMPTAYVGALDNTYTGIQMQIANMLNEAAAGHVNGLTLTAHGSGFTQASVFFTGAGGSGATATASIGYAISSITMINGGNFLTPTTIGTTGHGSGATFQAVYDVTNLTFIGVGGSGTGYAVADQITLAGGTGTPVNIFVDNVSASGAILSGHIDINNRGAYTALPGGGGQVGTTGGSGSGAQILPQYGIIAVNVTGGGNDYDSTSLLTFTGGGGTNGAVGQINLAATGRVSFLTLTGGGSNYVSDPNVVISGDGTGATATATISSSGDTITIPIAVNVPNSNYAISLTPSQGINASWSSKTAQGFNLILTPLNSGIIATGNVDVIVELTN